MNPVSMMLGAFKDRRPGETRRRKHRGRIGSRTPDDPSHREIDRRIRELNRRLQSRSRFEESIFEEGERFATGAGTA